MAIRRARYIENVESEALEAIARWSVIGKVVRFEWVSDRKWYVILDFRAK